MIQGIYKKHTANIILNVERIHAFTLRSGTTQGLETFTRTKKERGGGWRKMAEE